MTKVKYDWDAIARDYQDGVQSNEICEKFKMPIGYLRKKACMLKLKRPNEFVPEQPKTVWTKDKIEKLKQLNDKKLSPDLIAKKFNLSKGTIHQKMSNLKRHSRCKTLYC